MMKKLILLSCFIYFSINNIHGKFCDKSGEIFSHCGGACGPTCENPIPKCPKTCYSGCVCDLTLRNTRSGECVPSIECPTGQCRDPKEYYTDCGSACPETCENDNEGPCTDNCVPGCFCRTGYIRNKSTGQCVLPEDCSSNITVCYGKNEVYSECMERCLRTCKVPFPPCPPPSVPCDSGCECAPGYIRNGDDYFAECVREEQCPSDKCPGQNEYFTNCACPVTCDNDHRGPCTDNCVEGCFCVPGYVRNKLNGKCVRPWECYFNCFAPYD